MKKTFIICQEHLKTKIADKYPDAVFFTEDYVKQMSLTLLKETRKERPDSLIGFVYDLNRLPNKDYWKCIFALSGARKKYLIDSLNREEKATFTGAILHTMPKIATEKLLSPFLIKKHLRIIRDLSQLFIQESITKNRSKKILFLRTDFAFGMVAGGSVAHLNGVTKGFKENDYDIIFVSNDQIPMIEENIRKVHILEIPQQFRNIPEVWALKFNDSVIKFCENSIDMEKIDFVYQRYSLNNYSGLFLARQFRVPFVVEYNGSEVWIGRSWGRGLKYPALAEEIETINLREANLVIVVSDIMKQELIERGVKEEKILVNPNGYDEYLFHPDIDGSEIRRKFGFESNLVIGFIGTFGKWHGAETLARAAPYILNEKTDARFLFIREGITKPETERIIREEKIEDKVIFTGLIPQKEAPKYLAACDILVAPHVQNPDGTEFFGSPTKLFEYMGMGKAIVASKLGQIGQVIKHEINGLSVAPGI